jgi:hypothetical protein
MRKMTGAEYNAFMHADWDSLLGLTDAYVSGEEVTIDGVDEIDDGQVIADTAKVVIYSGCIMANEDVNMSLETCFSRWKKAQTKTTLCVEVPNESVEAFKTFVASLKGKVLK